MSAHTPEGSDASAQSPPIVQTSPTRRRRWRTRIILLSSAIAVACFARFAYLRLTLRPTPRPEYWAAKIAALAAPGPDAIDAARLLEVLQPKPWLDDGSEWRSLINSLGEILNGPWDESRSDVQLATKAFSTQAYADSRAALADAVRRGWSCGPDMKQAWYRRGREYHEWMAAILAHSRWARGHLRDWDAAIEDWKLALEFAHRVMRVRANTEVRLGSTWMSRVAREVILAVKEPHDSIDTRQLMLDIEGIISAELRPTELLEGERLYQHHVLESRYVRFGGSFLCVDEAMWTEYEVRISRLWNLTSPVFHDLHEARRVLDYWHASLDQYRMTTALEQLDIAAEHAGPNELEAMGRRVTIGCPLCSNTGSRAPHWMRRSPCLRSPNTAAGTISILKRWAISFLTS